MSTEPNLSAHAALLQEGKAARAEVEMAAAFEVTAEMRHTFITALQARRVEFVVSVRVRLGDGRCIEQHLQLQRRGIHADVNGLRGARCSGEDDLD